MLEDLVYGTFMSKYDYRIIHDESPDRRGIDVCMVYRKDCLSVIDYEYWIPSGDRHGGFLLTKYPLFKVSLWYRYNSSYRKSLAIQKGRCSGRRGNKNADIINGQGKG